MVHAGLGYIRVLEACAQSAATRAGAGQSGGTLQLITYVVASFLRLVTHPRVFSTPTPTEQAIAFLDALQESPGIAILDMSTTCPVFRHLYLDKNLSANSIPDALIAAAVAQNNEVLATFDQDFSRLLLPHQLQLLVG